MTTIKSVFEYSPQTLLVETGTHEGETYLRINNGKSPMGDAMVATADLLAALDAVPRERLAEAEDDAATAQAELRAVTAEHDALAATVERVRAWAEDYFGVLDEAPDELRVVLDPKPAFVLPTEAGAGITATYRVTGEEYELRLFSNGSWFDSAGDESTPEQLMDPAKWTDHRLLDGAE